jgi:polyisoprenoid-binding protein YceI
MSLPLSRFASSPSLASLRDAGGGRTDRPGKAGSTGAMAYRPRQFQPQRATGDGPRIADDGFHFLFFERSFRMNLSTTLSRFLLGAALTLSAQAVFAQQQLVPAQSEVQFTARQMGVPLDGHFKKFSAQVAFDPAKLATSKIAFTVDTGSATLGSRETDAELPKPAWFNVPKFPQAQFESSTIKALGGGKFEVAGKLTIKGTTQNVVVPVTLTQSGPNTTATGTLPIKRLAFKIGENEWADTSMVADDVTVKFKLALTGVGKP